MMGESRIVAGAGLVGLDVTINPSLYTWVYKVTHAEPSRAIINSQMAIPGSNSQILAPNSDWLTATFAVGSATGIQWSMIDSGMQPGGAPSEFRVISSKAADPATFSVDIDGFTSLLSPGFHVLHAGAEWSAGVGRRDSGGPGPAGGSAPFASSWRSMRGWVALSKS